MSVMRGYVARFGLQGLMRGGAYLAGGRRGGDGGGGGGVEKVSDLRK